MEKTQNMFIPQINIEIFFSLPNVPSLFISANTKTLKKKCFQAGSALHKYLTRLQDAYKAGMALQARCSRKDVEDMISGVRTPG